MFKTVESTASAKERYEVRYTFEDPAALGDFSCAAGQWEIRDGKLCTTEGDGSAYLFYDIPSAYAGMDFDVDIDFLGHTSAGALLIGAAFDGMPERPKHFHGYDCSVSREGTRAVLASYDQNGDACENVFFGQHIIEAEDLHLTVAVRGDRLVYRVFTTDRKTQYFGMTYLIGAFKTDVYTALAGRIGLRKSFADQGAFADFAVTFYPDVLPAELSEEKAPKDFSLTCDILSRKRTFLYFGMQDEKNGYAVVLNRLYETIGLYEVADGKLKFLCEKRCPVADEARKLRISVNGNAARVYYQDNLLVDFDDDYPKLDFLLDNYAAGRIGSTLAGGEISALEVCAAVQSPAVGYTNPVTVGADPDVLYYNGVYYMYNRIVAGNEIFRVSVSTDLVHWTPKNTVFTKEDSYTATGYMSPNVFYHEGIFYLFYAAHIENNEQRLYYATSDSPLGPFTHKNGQVPLHDIIREIGGHPFMDDDGRFYLTYVRFGKGNSIWIEELKLKNGVVTFVEGSLRELIVPQHEFEINWRGRCCEGGVIRKHNGYYYMIYATGWYNTDYGESYAVAKNVLGPYTRYPYNPILSSTAKMRGVGDGVFVSSPDGAELFIVYHCHKDMQTVEPRNTCIDRVRFV
ncbi:MAG: glycoside hydrolase family 43 protein, partial [Clostridia bacterium]|nr:glycoside hydrolase family 43 protein [Clostridia bacterium]